MNQTIHKPDKLADDEFALRLIAIGNTELAYIRDTFKKIGFELKTKKVLISLRRWNKRGTKFVTVRDCITVTVKQLEEALPKVYDLCKNTFFKEENPEKYHRYKAFERVYLRAKKGYEKGLDKSKPIYDDFYEEIRND